MYFKQASTLLVNWLKQNGCKSYNEAKTTESKYLLYGDIKIRISHHLPASVDKSTIYIMVPLTRGEYYAVFIERSFNTIKSLKELKSFLKSLFVITDCKGFSQICRLKTEITQLENQKKQLQGSSKSVV